MKKFWSATNNRLVSSASTSSDKELAELKVKQLEWIAEKNRAKAEGDLSENSAYVSAMEELDKISKRISELRSLNESDNSVLLTQEIVQKYNSTGIVLDYSAVKFSIKKQGGSTSLFSGKRVILPVAAGFDDEDVLDSVCPVAMAIKGHKVGDTVPLFNDMVVIIEDVY